MINRFQEDHKDYCSLFGLISVLTVAKSCGFDVPWVRRFFLIPLGLLSVAGSLQFISIL